MCLHLLDRERPNFCNLMLQKERLASTSAKVYQKQCFSNTTVRIPAAKKTPPVGNHCKIFPCIHAVLTHLLYFDLLTGAVPALSDAVSSMWSETFHADVSASVCSSASLPKKPTSQKHRHEERRNSTPCTSHLNAHTMR